MYVLSDRAMDSTMQTPLIWAQSILSHYLSPPTSFQKECHLLSLCTVVPSSQSPCGNAAIVHPRPAVPSLLSGGEAGVEGREWGPPGHLHSWPELFFPLALLPANIVWEPILAWGQEQRTTLVPPAKPKVPCALLENKMECKPLSHKTGPFCLASTT